MSGRGAYYKAKYGGGRGRGGYREDRGRVEPNHQHFDEPNEGKDMEQISEQKTTTAQGLGTDEDLEKLLRRINGKSYGYYKDLQNQSFKVKGLFTLYTTHIQADSFAPPSSFRIVVTSSVSKFPPDLYSNKSRRVSLADFLHRNMYDACHSRAYDQKRQGRGWHGEKGGEINVTEPCQHVFERTAVVVRENGDIEARVTINLPGQGRSILGELAITTLVPKLTNIVNDSVLYTKYDSMRRAMTKKHVDSVEDQQYLRNILSKKNLVAFVRNGAILPRASGDTDLPLSEKDAVPFVSPKELEMKIKLPHSGEIYGMGISNGITTLVGGGFHGKSTLINAIQLGIYDHIPGDGREFVVIDPKSVKIRSEDGRSVKNVNISQFIDNLPLDRDTKSFSTTNASGSTSQASNIMEYIEIGCSCILIDEDTSANNFMMRDNRMKHLVNNDPITPLTERILEIKEMGVSVILVIGGSGEYFSLSDNIIEAKDYKYFLVTEKAKQIAEKYSKFYEDDEEIVTQKTKKRKTSVTATPRKIDIQVSNRLVADKHGFIRNKEDDSDINLSFVEQLVDIGQCRYTAALLESKDFVQMLKNEKDMKSLAEKIEQVFDEQGVDIYNDRMSGALVRPRAIEVIAALNRLRTAKFEQQKK